MYRYKLRFNLGVGKNFRKWKLTDKVKDTHEYFDPEQVQFLLKDCRLVNQKSAANLIFGGLSKRTCAWIEFSSYHLCDIIPPNRVIRYNPKVAPHWVGEHGENADGMMYKRLTTLGNQVYVTA